MDACRGSQHELKGCINDAHCMKYLLTTRLGFKDSDIVMLTDDQSNPQAWPTRGNMVGPSLSEVLDSIADGVRLHGDWYFNAGLCQSPNARPVPHVEGCCAKSFTSLHAAGVHFI